MKLDLGTSYKAEIASFWEVFVTEGWNTFTLPGKILLYIPICIPVLLVLFCLGFAATTVSKVWAILKMLLIKGED